MNLRDYLERRAQLAAGAPNFRQLCPRCLQPPFSCYCTQVRPFDSQIKFVILMHALERRRRIATGRMSHLLLKNSVLLEGQNFTDNAAVNALINDESYQSLVLYPGPTSLDLSKLNEPARAEIIKPGRQPLIFVIDGTWNTARKTIWQSQNLKALPRICFTPSKPSNFRVRKQPRAGCCSTIEAIHQTIELLGDAAGFETSGRAHDGMLKVFDWLVDRQIQMSEHKRNELGGFNHRHKRVSLTAEFVAPSRSAP